MKVKYSYSLNGKTMPLNTIASILKISADTLGKRVANYNSQTYKETINGYEFKGVRLDKDKKNIN